MFAGVEIKLRRLRGCAAKKVEPLDSARRIIHDQVLAVPARSRFCIGLFDAAFWHSHMQFLSNPLERQSIAVEDLRGEVGLQTQYAEQQVRRADVR